MKKNSVLYHTLGLFAVPALFICILTAIASFATRKYEYLPEELDFLSTLFYYAAIYLLDFLIFYCIGAFCYSVHSRKVLPSALCALITLFHAGLLPIVMFFVRSVFLADVTNSTFMEGYWTEDVYTSMANFTKASVFLVIGGAVSLVLFLMKKETVFEKPYVSPKSEPAIASLTMSLAYLLFAMFSFTFGGEYDIPSLIFQLIFTAAGYFIIILGAYVQKKISIKNN